MRSSTKKPIDPTMQRLYAAAKDLRGKEGQACVAELLNVSSQQLRAWELRGISKDGAIMAREKIGCDLDWLFGKRASMLPSGQPGPIQEQANADPYVMIEQALRRLVIVGQDKDKIIAIIKERADNVQEIARALKSMEPVKDSPVPAPLPTPPRRVFNHIHAGDSAPVGHPNLKAVKHKK